MGLTRYHAKNHPQQTSVRGAATDVDDRATDVEWFRELDARFNFTIDVAASAANTKVTRFYDEQTDGLAQSWTGEHVWCNPPYSAIEPWVIKAHIEDGAPLIVIVVPANRTEQAWWQDNVEPYRDRPGSPLRTEFIRGRKRFAKPGQSIEPNNRPPFGVVLLIWDRR